MAEGGHDDELRIVVVGRTGCGKSSTCNTILGEQRFKVGCFAASVTKKLQVGSMDVAGKRVTVVDTPGIFDTELSGEEVIQQVAKSLIVTLPGLHALLYVVRVGARYTKEELKAYIRLKKTYGEDITSRTIIILTHGDVLEEQNLTLDDYKANSSPELKTVLRECGNNCIVFKNKDPDQEVHQLINMIQKLGRGHFQNPYTASIQESVDSEVRRMVEDVNEDELRNDPNIEKIKRDAAAHALEQLK